MKNIIVKISHIIHALKNINQTHMFDEVIYDRVRCEVRSGVGRPYYDLLVLDKTPNKIRISNIHESSFKLTEPIFGRISRFKKSYNFKVIYFVVLRK